MLQKILDVLKIDDHEWERLKLQLLFFGIIFAGFNFLSINLLPEKLVLFIDVLAVLALFCWRFPKLSFYAMIAVYPFIGWQINYGNFNVPLADWLALVVFTVLVWRLVTGRDKLTMKSVPGLALVALFWLSGLLSVTQAEFIGSALKYWLRPLVFFYLMYVLVPFNFIRRKRELNIVLILLVVAGLAVAMLGFLSLIQGMPGQAFRRALPFAFGGFNPLGGNQNAVAEVMVVTLPLLFIFMTKVKSYRGQGALVVLSMFVIAILLATFSRSGYLALILQVLILAIYYLVETKRHKYIWPLVLSLTILPAIFYIAVWQNVGFVQTSTSSRLVLSGIAWSSWLSSPILGHGPGTFIDIVGQTFVFVVEFGSPLDSHGFAQKLLVEQGALGLLSYFGLLAYFLWYLVREFSRENNDRTKFQILCFVLIFSSMIIFELFSTSYYQARFWLPLGVALSFIRLKNAPPRIKQIS